MRNAAGVGLVDTCAHPHVIDLLRPVLPNPSIAALSTFLLEPECRRESSPATDHAPGRGWRRGCGGRAAAQASAHAATGLA